MNDLKKRITALALVFLLCIGLAACTAEANGSLEKEEKTLLQAEESAGETAAAVTEENDEPLDFSGLEIDRVTASVIHNRTSELKDVLKSKRGGEKPEAAYEFSLADIPEYSDSPYCIVNGNKPALTLEGISDSFEQYGELDSLGRCTACIACIGTDLMPTEGRENISDIRPSGWNQLSLADVDGGVLYNRCHLIAFQLTAENANERNLITGTRYMNKSGMLPFEIGVGNYVRSSGNHVLYRVTPVFEGSNLVAAGVNIEALSVEDGGQDICFNVFCYNVQPDVEIDYATGLAAVAAAGITAGATAGVSALAGNVLSDGTGIAAESTSDGGIVNTVPEDGNVTYVLNTKSKKIHYPDCSGVADMKPQNRQYTSKSYDEIIAMGYEPCGKCNPSASGQRAASAVTQSADSSITYVLNTNTEKFHYPYCSSVQDIKPQNRQDTSMSRDEIIGSGYVPCKKCNP